MPILRRSFFDSAAHSVDVVIIGAGVIGLAVARALATRNGPRGDILVLDRAATIGSATSSRNSEVIHAGLYYPPLSLKGRLCVLGKQLLYEYCSLHHIPYRQCGKLVVATQPAQLDTLRQLQQQAQRNGVLDTKILSAHDTRAREPTLLEHNHHIQGALWSPSTGVVDSHALMQQFQNEAEETGHCTVVLRTAVHDAMMEDKSRCLWRVHAGDTWVSCRWVINCAGLWATPMAHLFHANTTAWQPPRQYFARGTYFRLQSSVLPTTAISHLMYPVPDPQGGLGVHLTMDCHQSQVKFGPDVEWVPVDVDDPDEIDLRVDPRRAAAFYDSIRTYWPDVPPGSLVPDYVGIRPKLSHPTLHNSNGNVPFQDFVVCGPETHGVPGVIHLLGMESPGLTSSLAIADHVANMVSSGGN